LCEHEMEGILAMLLSRLATGGIAAQVAARIIEILSFRRWKRQLEVSISALAVVVLVSRLFPVNSSLAQQTSPRNAIIFVADGLRPSSVNPTDTPTLYEVGQTGLKG